MGFVILMVMGAYLLISIAVVAWVVTYAQKHNRRGWLWGLMAAFVMYNLVFWDWIPTVVVHKYYCKKEAGFWVYKTLEQWKKENPGVMEGLVTQKIPPHEFSGHTNDLISTTFWNSRIKSVHQFSGPKFIHVWRREDALIDIKTGETLALYVDYSTSQERRQAGWSGWKFWLANDHCYGGRNKAISFVELVNQFKGAEK